MMSPSDPPVAAPTPPPFRDDGRTPNTPHDYADDPETGCCLVCGWSEATHHGSRVATPTPPLTKPRGTFACPICGIEGIHAHGDDDIWRWLDAQASRFGYRLLGTRRLVREDDALWELQHRYEAIARRVNEEWGTTPLGRHAAELLRKGAEFATEQLQGVAAPTPETPSAAYLIAEFERLRGAPVFPVVYWAWMEMAVKLLAEAAPPRT